MKFKQKGKIVLKIWLWASLSINALIMFGTFYCFTFDNELLLLGLATAVAIIILGALKISRDIDLNNMSAFGIFLDYITIFMISLLFANFTYDKTNLLGALLIIIAIVIEAVIAIVIALHYHMFK